MMPLQYCCATKSSWLASYAMCIADTANGDNDADDDADSDGDGDSDNDKDVGNI